MLYEAILFETPEDAMPVRRTVEVETQLEGFVSPGWTRLRKKYPRCEIISVKAKTESEGL